eukprot:Rmarinus@m.5827
MRAKRTIVEAANPSSTIELRRSKRLRHAMANKTSGDRKLETALTAQDALNDLRSFLEYVEAKPSLLGESPSFVFDHFRTLNQKYKNNDPIDFQVFNYFNLLPDEITAFIFSFLDGHDLFNCLQTCKAFHRVALEDTLWKSVCIRRCRSLETDIHLLQFLGRRGNQSPKNDFEKQQYQLTNGVPNTPPRTRRGSSAAASSCDEEGSDSASSPKLPLRTKCSFRAMYPAVSSMAVWQCELKKTGRFVCRLNAFHLQGPEPQTRPTDLIVGRRFNLDHLHNFILPEASLLYFEPLSRDDDDGYEEFISYLKTKHRAGLALEEDARIIFIPPCSYAKDTFGYEGERLLGVVQAHFPPLVEPQPQPMP